MTPNPTPSPEEEKLLQEFDSLNIKDGFVLDGNDEYIKKTQAKSFLKESFSRIRTDERKRLSAFVEKIDVSGGGSGRRLKDAILYHISESKKQHYEERSFVRELIDLI